MVSQPRHTGHVLSVTGAVTVLFSVAVFGLIWFNVLSSSCLFVSAFQMIFSVFLLVVGGLVLVLGIVLKRFGRN